MSVAYRRPDLATPVCLDDAGRPIPYGEQWADREDRMPPTDSYSVDRHPERFRPLHLVADALVDHVTAAFAVTLQTPALDEDVDRAVRLVPNSADAAPLTLRWLPYPAVEVLVGLHTRRVCPGCGCEACDETWLSAADELEQVVFACVEGRISESVVQRDRAWWDETSIVDERGDAVSGSSTRLSGRGHQPWARRWQPWPVRPA